VKTCVFPSPEIPPDSSHAVHIYSSWHVERESFGPFFRTVVFGGFVSGPWYHMDLENSWLCSVIFTCSNGKYQGFIFQWFGGIFPMIFQYLVQWFKNNLGVFLGGPKQMQVLLSLRSSDIEAETWHKRRAATFLGNHRHRSMVAICCYHCLNNSVLDISEENNGKYLKIGYIQINWV
jgi:hypothetical protein